MQLHYIIEICIALDIAILSISYPIIIDKISNIGEKYSSDYLFKVFNFEFPQKEIKWLKGVSSFQFILYFTVFTFLFQIFQFQPLFGLDNCIINNSADALVLISTFFLIILFFIWLNKVFLFIGKSNNLLEFLILKYRQSQSDSQPKNYYLKTINEFTIYAIHKQDEHIQNNLLDFYASEITQINKNFEPNEQVVYPNEYYSLIFNICKRLAKIDNNNLEAIEHRAVSGNWLIGGGFENNTISNLSFEWLWRNVYTICKNENYMNSFWANSSQYFNYHFKYLEPKYDPLSFDITNQNEIDKINERKDKFLEFHFAFGGLLLFMDKYDSIKYAFEFSNSLPYENGILPNNMTSIYKWFIHFDNPYSTFDLYYYFPGLDNLGNNWRVVFYIKQYILLLFIRQYFVTQRYTYENFIGQPNLPENQNELRNWLNSVRNFEFHLNKLLENQIIFDEINFKINLEHHDKFKDFVEDLKKNLESKIKRIALDAEISVDKKDKFNKSTIDIIQSNIIKYSKLYKIDNNYKSIDKDLKLFLNGETTLFPKSAFVDNGDTFLNFDNVIGKEIVRRKINRFLPDSYLIAKTDNYLFDKRKLIIALNKLNINEQNTSIICFNATPEIKETISNSDFNNFTIHIDTPIYDFQNTFFILNSSYLPILNFKTLPEEEIVKYKLINVDEKFNIYTSVVDLNKPENLDLKKSNLNKHDEYELKVLVVIGFIFELTFPKDRRIVQINLISENKEQGIENKIDEIKPLNIK